MSILVAVIGRTSIAGSAKDAAPPRSCAPAGGLLFEIDQLATSKAKLTTAKTRLYGNGAWKTEFFDVDGKLARTRAGCLEHSQLDSIKAGLRSAKFTTTASDATCRKDDPRFTVYKLKGKTLYTEHSCNVDVLDRDSRGALDLIEYYLSVPSDPDGAGSPRPRGHHVTPECLADPLASGCK